MSFKAEYEVIIIGAGPAGFTAGIYLGRFRFKTLIVESMTDYSWDSAIPAARSSIAGYYHNVPGFPDGIQRETLKWLGIQQAKNAGCSYSIDEVQSITKNQSYLTVHFKMGNYTTEYLFFATGLRNGWPDLPGLHNYVGRSLFWSVESNGKEAEGKPSAILGNDEYSAMEAVRLRDFSPQVFLLTNGLPLECSKEIRSILAHYGISIVENRIKAVLEENSTIQGLILEGHKEVPVQYIFSPVEHKHPRSQLAVDLGVHVDAAGFIHVNERFETNITNVYAIGDVTARGPEQVITAYYHGMKAAWSLHEEHFKGKLHHLFTSVSA